MFDILFAETEKKKIVKNDTSYRHNSQSFLRNDIIYVRLVAVTYMCIYESFVPTVELMLGEKSKFASE